MNVTIIGEDMEDAMGTQTHPPPGMNTWLTGDAQEAAAATAAPPGAQGGAGQEEDGAPSELLQVLNEMKMMQRQHFEQQQRHAEEIAYLKKELERQLTEKRHADRDGNSHELKPIDIKDLERPEEYDGSLAKFEAWIERLRDLMMNRHASWGAVLDSITKRGKTPYRNNEEWAYSIEDLEFGSSIRMQVNTYVTQLRSYLKTYTMGELHMRVTHTDIPNIMELMRDIITKGRNRNENRMVDLQAKALDPRKANKLNDLQKVLTEWRHTRQQVKEEDPSFVLTDKQLRAIPCPKNSFQRCAARWRTAAMRVTTSPSSRRSSTRWTRGRWMRKTGRRRGSAPSSPIRQSPARSTTTTTTP